MPAKRRAKRMRGPGRPRGPETVPYSLRLTHEQMSGLKTLGAILPGKPKVNGLIQDAVEHYITAQLENSAIRQRFEAIRSPQLRVIS